MSTDILFRIASRSLPVLGGDAFDALVRGAAELARDGRGNATLRAADGRVIKLLSPKRGLSSSVIRPYAVRFASNSALLMAAGVRAPVVDGVWAVPPRRLHAVRYAYREGEPLRDALARPGAPEDAIRRAFVTLLARLAAGGLAFRALHLGNVLLCPDGELALVDVVDVAAARNPAASVAASLRLLRGRYRSEGPLVLGPASLAQLDAALEPLDASARAGVRDALARGLALQPGPG